MAINTTLEIVEYYSSLLIFQYVNLPNASGTIQASVTPIIMPQTSVQQISFSSAPTTGTFVLSYDGNNTASISWNATASTIQTDLQALSGLSSVTVSGSIASLSLVVTFTGVTPPALSLEVFSTTLFASSTSVVITITETDLTIPLAVQNAFNLIPGTGTAVGDQLDILGKYAGVNRTGQGFTTDITLDDADFLSLIQMAITTNSAGSSLFDIQAILQQFFAGQIYVFDYQNMTMSYVISQGVGSQDLVQLFVNEGLLPVPMGVAVTIVYPPTANLFSFRTYEAPVSTGSPFNDYSSYQLDWPWLSYSMAI